MTEKRHDIKLIALDMDGTLITREHEVSKANQEAIAKAMAKGIGIILSTGRWLKFCSSYAADLKLNNYFVTVNGGEIWSPSEELVERHVHAPERMAELWQLGNEMGVRMTLVSTNHIYKPEEPPKEFHGHEWLKISYHTRDSMKLSEVKEALLQYKELELTNSTPINIEVNPNNVNKANGVKRVCDELGIGMHQVMAVGDSMNDLKMIEQAGIGVAMGNGQDAVKAVADFITDTNEHDGVAKAIERFIF